MAGHESAAVERKGAEEESLLARLTAENERLSAALAAAEARIAYLQELSDQDPLVPTLNRRAFLREAARYAALAERYEFLASLLYIDLDGLKAINDREGHAAGDAALSHIAGLLLRHTRASDLVGRLSGDEFAVLLVQTDRDTAARKGELLRREAARRPLLWNGRPLAVALACGAAALQGPGHLLTALEEADRAMYRQKGRR